MQEQLGEHVKDSWQRFLEEYEPLRPQLYRYCRHLSRSPWAAEDLAQDALARAFVTLACMREPPANPRAWLFRVASNLWINQVKRLRELPMEEEPPGQTQSLEPRASREALGTLLSQLSPQERAAVVLKDAFDFSVTEVADVLATTPGAIKAALHRGRDKLAEAPAQEPAPVAPALLDAFCAAFNARDLERLTTLLLDSASVELPGLVVEYGPDAAKAGTFRGTLFGCPLEAPAPLPNVRSTVCFHRGEWLLLWWLDDAVHTIVRVTCEGEQIAHLTSYYHAPDVIAEVCRELGQPYRTHGYRFGTQGAHS